MASYTPTALAGAFDSGDVVTNLDDALAAINDLESTNNFSAGKLTHRGVRPGALTQTWATKSNDRRGFVVPYTVTAPTTLTDPRATSFDAVGTGLRFHVHSTARLIRLYSWFEVRKNKADWLLVGETMAPEVGITLYHDLPTGGGPTALYNWTEVGLAAGKNEKRGVVLQISSYTENVPAGWYNAHMRIIPAGATTHIVANRLNQHYGQSRGTVAQIYYK